MEYDFAWREGTKQATIQLSTIRTTQFLAVLLLAPTEGELVRPGVAYANHVNAASQGLYGVTFFLKVVALGKPGQ